MDFINYIEKLNWPTIIGMFAIGWYFTREIKETLVKLESDVREQGKRTSFPQNVSLSKDSIAEAFLIPPEVKPHKALNGVLHLIRCYKALAKDSVRF